MKVTKKKHIKSVDRIKKAASYPFLKKCYLKSVKNNLVEMGVQCQIIITETLSPKSSEILNNRQN